jgi:hypothetical protein
MQWSFNFDFGDLRIGQTLLSPPAEPGVYPTELSNREFANISRYR